MAANGNSGIHRPYTAVMIVPTGVGAKIGGYAGDALPAARLLRSVVDVLVTHPNVLNGAMMYWPMENVMYVEGYALDEFAAGRLRLSPQGKRGHKIGLLLDKAIEPNLQLRHMQVADAARATLGIDVSACVVTSKPVGVSICISNSGASWGTLGPHGEEVLIEGARALLDEGCTAIAVVARFPEDEDEGGEKIEEGEERKMQAPDNSSSSAIRKGNVASLFAAYRQGEGVDAVAGAEALISHVITKELKVPCAHAPAFDEIEVDPSVSPKCCAEEIGYTFLPCVLAYLHRAPFLIHDDKNDSDNGKGLNIDGCITCRDVDAVVVPANALGGPAVLSFLSQGALIIAVEDNTTAMQVTADDILTNRKVRTANAIFTVSERIVRVRSYAEAAGILSADREGILLDAITPFVPKLTIRQLS